MIKVQKITSIEIDGDDLNTLANVCEIVRRVTVDSSQTQDFKDKDINKILYPVKLCHNDYQTIRALIDKCQIAQWGWQERD